MPVMTSLSIGWVLGSWLVRCFAAPLKVVVQYNPRAEVVTDRWVEKDLG